jgi:hypothetical protein
MGLLFEDAGKNGKVARKWQCFVCGRNYEDFQTYKEHIFQTHEEGREYVRCPDCTAPVRDLVTHYKAKHPKRVMPKGVQTRVAVWHDFKSGSEKKKTTRKPTFRTGSFTSKKSGCDLPYRSGLECEFYELLEADNDVASFFPEPFKVPYYFQGQWHDYIPDIRINYIDGSTEIWEVKPANQTAYDQNRAKWASMNDHALNHGWGFVVQTEVGLGKLKAKVKRQQGLNEEQT